MEQYDLFAELGFKVEGPTKKEEKKNNNKKAGDKSKTQKPKDKANKTADKVKLPVVVYTGYEEPFFLDAINFNGTNEVSLRDIQEYIAKCRIDYPVGLSTLQKGKEGVLYLVHRHSYMVTKPDIHVKKETALVFVNTRFDLSAIKTAAECDIEIKTLQEHFKNVIGNKFGNVGFIHSAVDDVIISTFCSPVLTTKVSFPVSIKVFGRQDLIVTKEEYIEAISKVSKSSKDTKADEEETEDAEDTEDTEDLSDEDNVTVKSNASVDKASADILKKIVIQHYPDFDDGHLELLWDKETKSVIAKMIEKTYGPAPVKEVYLPTNAKLSLLYTTIQLSPEMFDGEEEITKEELRKFIEKDRPEYSRERTDISYQEKKNLIIMVCTGSRKGADILYDRVEAMNKILGDKDVLFDWQIRNNIYRVEKTKFSCTMANKADADKGKYQLYLPKIPINLSYIARQVFSNIYKEHGTEAMMQLFWNKEKEEYFWFVPEQLVTPDACDIVRDLKREIKYMNQYILIADFHSHGGHTAFFSDKDDKDEQGCRLYGVIGDFDKSQQSFRLRAGTGGYYVNLKPDSIFNFSIPISDVEDFIIEMLIHEADSRITYLQ